MTPLGKKILVNKDSVPTKKGSLYIPDSGRTLGDPPYIGTILSRGPLCTDPDMIPGARVLYHWTAGLIVDDGDLRLVLLDESEITAVLKNN
jgi:co-chaperonin GroES (HSP10)